MNYINKLPKNTRFIVDPEFEALIPPLSEDEFKQLRDNIIEVGECRDPLIVWYVPGTSSDYIIVDGHNRWRVIQEFVNTDSPIRFTFHSEIFFNRDEVKAWIIRNQLGRRNISSYVRTELALKLKPLLAQEAKESQGTRTDILPNSAKSEKPKNTRQEIAKIAGVSGDTVARVEKIVELAPEEVKADLRAGKVSINKAYSTIKREPIESASKMASDMVKSWASSNKRSDKRALSKVEESTKSIVAEMYNTSTIKEATVEDVVDDIMLQADEFMRMVKNILTDHSTLLTIENKPIVAKAIQEHIIDKASSLKGLIEN